MKKMRIAFMMIVLAAISAESYAAMNMTDIRREARFLTDRMGHELGLSNRQYNDVYEINFDFLYQANEVIDDVVYGYDDAIDYYYYLLDVRNEDLMYVLRNNQYRKFVKRDYFYRPIYMVGSTWGMRIWSRYTDRNYFYFSIPTCYHTYSGAHYRIHFAHSYYADRYHHKLYHGAFRLWGGGYKHHHHDGWVSNGKRKHGHGESRPWSNAKNYEKSRHNLREGFVNIPSRDADKRIAKTDSEANRRTAVTSDTPTRSSSSHTECAKTTTSNRTTTTNRNSATTTTHRTTSGSTVKRENKPAGSVSSSRTNSTGTARSSETSTSSSRSSKLSSTNVSRSSNASKSTGASSSSRSNVSNKNSSSASNSRSSSVSSGSSSRSKSSVSSSTTSRSSSSSRSSGSSSRSSSSTNSSRSSSSRSGTR